MCAEFFVNAVRLARWKSAQIICTQTKPRHSPGLFRFRLHHTRRSELGVLLELIYFEARHIGGPFLFLEHGNDRSSEE